MVLRSHIRYEQGILLMLWSQIKLTSYDFSDLHITGEFDNCPGTGRFLRIFSCVVTYRTGAKDCKKFNSTCSLHVNHPQLLKRNIYFCIYVLGL